MKKIDLCINWLLAICAVVIVIYLLIYGVTWIPIGIYWVISFIKFGILIFQESGSKNKVKDILIAISAIVAAVLLFKEITPWLSIATFWVIYISKREHPFRDTYCIMPFAFLFMAIIINIIFFTGLNPWPAITFYWIIAAMRNLYRAIRIPSGR